MTQAVEVALDATTRTREQERDRQAWNLPQARTRPAAAGDRIRDDGLEWQAFSAAHFPGRRRHDLQAIVAYGAYRRRRPENERLPA